MNLVDGERDSRDGEWMINKRNHGNWDSISYKPDRKVVAVGPSDLCGSALGDWGSPVTTYSINGVTYKGYVEGPIFHIVGDTLGELKNRS